jgi:hypothetical protein
MNESLHRSGGIDDIRAHLGSISMENMKEGKPLWQVFEEEDRRPLGIFKNPPPPRDKKSEARKMEERQRRSDQREATRRRPNMK